MQARTRFTYPGGMEGWVELVYLIAHRRPAGSLTSDLSITSSTPKWLKWRLKIENRYRGTLQSQYSDTVWGQYVQLQMFQND